MPAYVDLNTLHNPTTGTAPPASWGDAARDNFEAIARAPKTKVTRATNLVLVATTVTPIAFSTIAHQQAAGVIWAIANPTRLVAPIDGVFHYDAAVTYPVGAVAAYGALFVRVNGVTYVAEDYANTNPIGASCSCVGDVSLVAGDYIEVCAYNSAAATIVAGTNPQAGMHWTGLL